MEETQSWPSPNRSSTIWCVIFMSYCTYSNLLVSAEESDDDEVLLKMKSLTLDQSIVNMTSNKEAAQAIACAIDGLPHNKVEGQLLSMRRLPFLRRNL